ncbi:MFS transporter [Acinetobacter pittii]|uniref:MFS transporter n=1 Tax=Acinetobacter pittii TaxID=48296 RepID=UPI0021D00ED2|nr:MFS transporter [Acinetobacter pittii]MCU4528177.1 MFS transporter [Acinetobacter pittii]
MAESSDLNYLRGVNMEGSIFNFNKYYKLTYKVHIIILGNFFSKCTYFMVWPFLSVILFNQFHLSATGVGALLTISSIIAAFSGVYAGYLSDHIGRKKIILVGAFISAVSFFILSYIDKVFWYYLIVPCISIGSALLMSGSNAMISDLVVDKESRELAFHYRYFFTNVSAALGPFIGVMLGLSAKTSTFILTSIVFFIFSALLWIALPDIKNINKIEKNNQRAFNFYYVCVNMLKHRLLMKLLIINALLLIVYANFDSTLVQYITRYNNINPVETISYIFITNALVVIFAQFLMLRLLNAYSLRTRLFLGVFVICVSQILFACIPATFLVGLVISTIVLSVGELMVYPAYSVEIDRIAPDEFRGSYFGLMNLLILVKSIAPLYGGVMLDLYGKTVVFFSLAGMCAFIFILLINYDFEK